MLTVDWGERGYFYFWVQYKKGDRVLFRIWRGEKGRGRGCEKILSYFNWDKEEKLLDWGTNLFLKSSLSNFCQHYMEERFFSISTPSFWLRQNWRKKRIGSFLVKELGDGKEDFVYWSGLMLLFCGVRWCLKKEIEGEWKKKFGRKEEELFSFWRSMERKGKIKNCKTEKGEELIRFFPIENNWRAMVEKLSKELTPFLPMVALPTDWKKEDVYSGGYWRNKECCWFPLQSKKRKEEVYIELGARSFESVNRLQHEGYQVDWDFLKIISLFDLFPKEKGREWMRVQVDWFFWLRTYLLPGDPIYFPWTMDGRGRLYTKGFLNPLSSWLVRMSLRGNSPYTGQKEEWEEWLKNRMGLVFEDWKETSWEERQKRWPELEEKLKNGFYFWEGDYQKISLWLEWIRSKQVFWKGVWMNWPILFPLDGTAHGIQLIFLLFRAEEYYPKVNLVPQGRKDPVRNYYSEVLEKFLSDYPVYLSRREELRKMVKMVMIRKMYGFQKKSYEKQFSVKELWDFLETLGPFSDWCRIQQFTGSFVWEPRQGDRVFFSGRRGFGAHLIHSLEAGILRTFLEKNCKCFPVHDGFWTSPDQLEGLREKWIESLEEVMEEKTVWTLGLVSEKEERRGPLKLKGSKNSLV